MFSVYLELLNFVPSASFSCLSLLRGSNDTMASVMELLTTGTGAPFLKVGIPSIHDISQIDLPDHCLPAKK